MADPNDIFAAMVNAPEDLEPGHPDFGEILVTAAVFGLIELGIAQSHANQYSVKLINDDQGNALPMLEFQFNAEGGRTYIIAIMRDDDPATNNTVDLEAALNEWAAENDDGL